MKCLRLLAAGLALFASGCLKVDETLTLEKNGAGSLELIYSIPDQTSNQMKSMIKLRDQMSAITGQAQPRTSEDELERIFFDPSEAQIRQVLKKYESFGITIEVLKLEARNAARNVTLTLAFKDIGRAAKADFFPEHGFSLSHNQDGTYTFLRTPEGEGFAFQPQNVSQDAAAILNPVLNGFRVALKVTTPGRIIESNASRKTLYNGAWIFDYDKNPNAVTALQKQSMKIVFEGKGITLPDLSQFPKATHAGKR